MGPKALPIVICWTIVLLIAVAQPMIAAATPPSTPIFVDLSLSHLPRTGEWVTVTITVGSISDAPGTYVELLLPRGVLPVIRDWVIDLTAYVPITLSTTVFVQAVGNFELSARAVHPAASGGIWGDMKTVPLYISPAAGAPAELGWKVDLVPVAANAQPGNTPVINTAPTPFAFTPVSAMPLPEPSTNAQAVPDSVPLAPDAPGTVTLTGRWQYDDRSVTARDIDQQLLEIRQGDGAALSPRAFCFTEVNGTFACLATHPGTSMRVWVWSWANFNVPTGGTNRLGVFSGNELSCGSDAIDCAYPVQTGEISCADGATCDVGTWVVSSLTGEPWLGAQQMTQDLVRSWKKLFFDTRHPASTVAGPGRINYPVPSGHGTHAHVIGVIDGWISIEPPNHRSADIVAHEYGHVVMSNLWAGYTPFWPTFDCPSPHFIGLVSGPGCALSEGFADFWAWYTNEFYDGDASPGNDGPMFDFPGGGATSMETRDNGTYQSGDQVEGNVAAALGDFLDTADDGPIAGRADRLSDGVQHVWHTFFIQSDSNFSEWWNAYWSTLEHPPCLALETLQFNSILYSLAQCQTFTLLVISAGGGSGTVTSAPGGIDCGADCSEEYASGTAVTLTPAAAGGSVFAGWSGACTGSGGCVVTMDANKSVTAAFTPLFTLRVARAGGGSGTGTVTSAPAGISCGADCSESYPSGTEVRLDATAAGDSIPGPWTGCDSLAGTSCLVTMFANRSVIATFDLPLQPSVGLQLNKLAFRPGETMILTATLTSGTAGIVVDAYIVIQTPDGGFFSLQGTEAPVPGIAPIVRGFTPVPFAGEIIRYTFSGGEPTGIYRWFGALTEAGTLRVIGAPDQHVFTFSP
ncbi:MAG: InlB B-repeat-containing protein [Candidatus Rokuibacteriota bacterium]